MYPPPAPPVEKAAEVISILNTRRIALPLLLKQKKRYVLGHG